MLKSVLISSLLILCCLTEQEEQRFKLQNNTSHTFTDIYLFGNKIDTLAPGVSSDWKTYRYNPVTDDSMIYCKFGNTRYACYLNFPEKGTSEFTYSIRAIQNGILMVDFIDQEN